MLGKDQRIRVGILHNLPEFLPECMIELLAAAQVCRHIQPPAVGVVRVRHPFASDIQNKLLQIRRIFIIQLRKGFIAPPSGITPVVRPVALPLLRKLKIIMVRAVFGHIGPGIVAFRILINKLAVHPFIK